LTDLDSIGWNDFFQSQRDVLSEHGLSPARVAVAHRDRYELLGPHGHRWAELAGRLRHQAQHAVELPTVGDWVGTREGRTIVHLFERRSTILRSPAGKRIEPQLLAANIDTIFVVTSFDLDFNPRRIERYVATVWESGAEAVIVLNKSDLCRDTTPFLDRLGPSVRGLPVVIVSALEDRGVDRLREHIGAGRTAAMLGSSGVGKSALTNRLLGREVQTTGSLRSDGRGRHTTTRRELMLLPGGGLLIDTPGIRELKLWSDGEGVEAAFGDIERAAGDCRFSNCTHQHEPGCAVQAALQAGSLSRERLDNYRKLEREQAWLARRADPVLMRNSKQRWKAITKSVRKRYNKRARNPGD
jgi:ribosome biogenesis GTPase